MTCRCKFDIGNCESARLAMGTADGAIHQSKLSRCEATGCSASEHVPAPLVLSRMAERVASTRRQNDAETRPAGGVASSVSWWRHVAKVMWGNSGDRMVSRVVNQPICWMALVAPPISARSERAARHHAESDGFTVSMSAGKPDGEKEPCLVHGCSGFMEEPIPERVRGK